MPDRFHTDAVSGATSGSAADASSDASPHTAAHASSSATPRVAPDATSGATPAFERGSGSISGQSAVDASQSRQPDDKGESLVKGSSVSVDEVQDLIDAVAGATWSTRNRIMEERFHSALEKGSAKVPAFKPPGEAIGS